MAFKVSKSNRGEEDTGDRGSEQTVRRSPQEDADRDQSVDRHVEQGQQGLSAPIQRVAQIGTETVGASDPSGNRGEFVDYDPGPDRQSLQREYDVNLVRDGQAAKLQRLKDEHGSESVQRWASEGMTVDTMGKPKDMQAFRRRQAGRPPEVPTDVERRNQSSVHRNADADEDAGPAGDAGAPDAVRDVVSSRGTSMDESVQREMESKMGGDFSDVQVHTGPKAASAAESINARAFTVGNHVAFNQGEYEPGSKEGKKVMAHELTHVRQQTDGKISMLPKADSAHPSAAAAEAGGGTVTHRGTEMHVQPKLEVSSPDSPAEKEAERVAEQVVRMDDGSDDSDSMSSAPEIQQRGIGRTVQRASAGSGAGHSGGCTYTVQDDDFGLSQIAIDLEISDDGMEGARKIVDWNDELQDVNSVFHPGQELNIEEHGPEGNDVEGMTHAQEGSGSEGDSQQESDDSGGESDSQDGESATSPTEQIENYVQMYMDGAADLPMLAGLLLPFADSHGQKVNEELQNTVGWRYRDDVSNELAKAAENGGGSGGVGLGDFDEELLSTMETCITSSMAYRLGENEYVQSVEWIRAAQGSSSEDGGGQDSEDGSGSGAEGEGEGEEVPGVSEEGESESVPSWAYDGDSIARVDDSFITRREEWGARQPNGQFQNTSHNGVVIHHTVTEDGEDSGGANVVKKIQGMHMDGRDYTDIGYHLLIDSSGNVYEGRPIGAYGAHGVPYNDTVGIALLGGFHESANPFLAVDHDDKELTESSDGGYDVPSPAQIQATVKCIQIAKSEYGISLEFTPNGTEEVSGDTIKPHGRYATKQCPGEGVYERFQAMIEAAGGSAGESQQETEGGSSDSGGESDTGGTQSPEEETSDGGDPAAGGASDGTRKDPSSLTPSRKLKQFLEAEEGLPKTSGPFAYKIPDRYPADLDDKYTGSPNGEIPYENEVAPYDVYPDDGKDATIGIGHSLTAGMGSAPGVDYLRRTGNMPTDKNLGITTSEAYSLLEEDMEDRAAQPVRNNITVPLTQAEFDALVSFTFNLGSGWMQAGDPNKSIPWGVNHGVSDEQMRTNFMKYDGADRRSKEADMFIEGTYHIEGESGGGGGGGGGSSPESDESGGDSDDSGGGSEGGSGGGATGEWEYTIPAQDNGNPHWPSTVANNFLNLDEAVDASGPAWHPLLEWNDIPVDDWQSDWDVGTTLTVREHGADPNTVEGLEPVGDGGGGAEEEGDSGGGDGSGGGDVPTPAEHFTSVLEMYNKGNMELRLTARMMHGFAESHGALLKEKIDQVVDGSSQDTLAYKLAERGHEIGQPVALSDFDDELLEGMRADLQAGMGAWGSHAVAVGWINSALDQEGARDGEEDGENGGGEESPEPEGPVTIAQKAAEIVENEKEKFMGMEVDTGDQGSVTVEPQYFQNNEDRKGKHDRSENPFSGIQLEGQATDQFLGTPSEEQIDEGRDESGTFDLASWQEYSKFEAVKKGKASPENITEFVSAAAQDGIIKNWSEQTDLQETYEGDTQHVVQAWMDNYGVGIDCSGLATHMINEIRAAIAKNPEDVTGNIGLDPADSRVGNKGAGWYASNSPSLTSIANENNSSETEELRPGDVYATSSHIKVVMGKEETEDGIEIQLIHSTGTKEGEDKSTLEEPGDRIRGGVETQTETKNSDDSLSNYYRPAALKDEYLR